MNFSKPKPKFIPPIRTAASYLKTISESSMGTKYDLSPIFEQKQFKLNLERTGSTIINSSPPETKRELLKTSIGSRQKSSKKVSRDISHLQDLRYSKTEPDLQGPSSGILPTEIEKLKKYVQVAQEPKIKTQRSQVCFRNSCIGNINDRVKAGNVYKTFEDFSVPGEFGGPTGQYEIASLRDWFRFMKENNLSRIIEEVKEGKKQTKMLEPYKVGEFEVILKAAIKEFVKQLNSLNSDRGELLLDILHYLNLFWVARLEQAEVAYKENRKGDKMKIEELSKKINESHSEYNEKIRILKHELGVVRSENLLKVMEISNLQEGIKKLKAERIYRTKLELQRYNNMIKQFSEFRSSTLTVPEDPNNIKIAKALQKKKESLTSNIISKIHLLHSNTSIMSSRLTENHLIEHAMLSIDFEEIFVDKSLQVDYSDFCVTRTMQVEVPVNSVGVDTEEFMDVMVEEVVNRKKSEEVTSAELYSIFFTSENGEKVLLLSKHIKEPDDHEEINMLKEKGEDYKSIKTIFKSKYVLTESTQTEEKIFAEILRMDEEEFLDWIIKDRKDHLHNIQRQILNSKTELKKVNKFMSNHRNVLCQSFNIEEGLDISLNSEESFNVSVDDDLEYLRNSGIIGPEVDIPSWRDGYTFGFESRKSRGLTPRHSRKQDESVDTSNIKSNDQIQLKPRHKKNPSDELKRKKSTKIQEFRFQNKDYKNIGSKHIPKPKFLENFLTESRTNQSKRALISKKMVLKTISNIYSAAIAKDCGTDLQALHIFVYEEFYSRYGQLRVVNKKITDLMSAVLVYMDERRITTFAKLFGISVKVDIPSYSRPKEAFKFFIEFNRLLETSHFGISVGDIKGKTFIPLIRAIECSRELLSKYFESNKVNNTLNIIEKKSIADPNKINKKLVEQEILLEILLDIYHEYNSQIESSLSSLLDPFRFLDNPNKLHKFDFHMILRYFYPEKFTSTYTNSPLDFCEQHFNHSKNKFLISLNKILTFCLQTKILTSDEIKIKLKDLNNDDNKLHLGGFEGEVMKYKLDLDLVLRNKEKFQFDMSFITNWERKIVRLIENPERIQDSFKVLWKIMATEVKRLISEC